MKKTFSMLLAVIMAAIAVCTFSVIGFADETTTNDDPVDNFVTTTETTTKAPETTKAATTTTAATTAAATTAAATTAVATTANGETTTNIIDGILGMLTTTDVSAENEAEPTVTRDPSQTYIDDGDETTKPATTKKPAKVESSIPSTGSGVIVPAVALLALAAGAVAVVKTKKED